MEYKEIAQKTSAELDKTRTELRTKLHGLRLQRVTGGVKNVRELRVLRKTIARINTALRANERSA
ncbi:50S ribosomal protein L29 [Patescibacteria group bacterium]|jgi:ribosomal protein L29|nr:50S ribosomal protein L29 [Patescibacteria group bacterium]